ncbi:protein of unknown function (plasmid) [Azospirillum baldaniorum]|uniref:Uncharacterized protein n=1 Tax=Azospirillum baldaniorum TaxID=1064539 RepID=A0A9P1JV59_9PROT|nr:protein of unknown function [Azospirillum baldaniorum]
MTRNEMGLAAPSLSDALTMIA